MVKNKSPEPSPELMQAVLKHIDPHDLNATMSECTSVIRNLRNCKICPFKNVGSTQCKHCTPARIQDALDKCVRFTYSLLDKKEVKGYHWQKEKEIQQASSSKK